MNDNKQQTWPPASYISTSFLTGVIIIGLSASIAVGQQPSTTNVEHQAIVIQSPGSGAVVSPEIERARIERSEKRGREIDDRMRQAAAVRGNVAGDVTEKAKSSNSIILVGNTVFYKKIGTTGLSNWMGELRNDGTSVETWVSIYLHFYDANGKDLGERKADVYGTCLVIDLINGITIQYGNNLTPRETGFFELRGPKYATQITKRIVSSNMNYIVPKARIDLVEPMTTVNDGGHVKLRGTLKNNSLVAAKYCGVYIALKDTAGNMLGVTDTSVDGSAIDGIGSGLYAGQSGSFSTMQLSVEYSQYSGRHSAKTSWDDYYQPVASFFWEPSSPLAGQQVHFFDTSLGGPTSWNWNFAGENIGNIKSPDHIFQAPGTFPVTLTAANSAGSNSITKEITVGGGNTYSDSFWIPVAINGAGVNSFWKSDLGLFGRGSGTSSAELRMYLADGVHTLPTTVTGGRQTILTDVVGQAMTLSGKGLMEIRSNQPLLVTSRTYNWTPTATFGQGYDGTPAGAGFTAGQTAYLTALTQNATYRTNLGISNTTSVAANVTVTLFDANGTQLSSFDVPIAAYTFWQEESFKKKTGRNDLDACYATVRVNSGSGLLIHASVTDNRTSDPTTFWARP